MRKLSFSLIIVLSIAMIYTACKKKKVQGCMDPASLNYNAEATEDDGTCEYYEGNASQANEDAANGSMAGTSEDVTIYTMASGEGESNTLSGKMAMSDSTTIPSGATVTLESSGINVWPKTITIDFGTTGIVCFDGKIRKGKIKAKFTGFWKLHDEGDSIIVTLEDYYANDTMFTGTRSFWIEDYVSLDGNLKVGYKAENASMVFPNNEGTISWEGEGTYNIEGLTTPLDISDDVFELDLSGSATSINGDDYTFETTSPLITKIDCIDDCVFIGGVFEVTSVVESDTTFTYGSVSKSYDLETTTKVSFDFGDGSVCDDKFNVTVDLEIESIDGSTSTVLYEAEVANDEYTCSALDTL